MFIWIVDLLLARSVLSVSRRLSWRKLGECSTCSMDKAPFTDRKKEMGLDQHQNPIRCAFERANRMHHNVCFVIEPTFSFRLCYLPRDRCWNLTQRRTSFRWLSWYSIVTEELFIAHDASLHLLISLQSRLYANDAQIYSCSCHSRTEMIWTIK